MNSLQVAAASPWWLHAGAAAILFLHIAGGTVGLVSGAAALAARKGSRAHRLAGNLFFVSMLFMAGIGAAVSPFLLSVEGDPRWFDALAGLFALYLVATGWATVRRRAGTVGRFEIFACLSAALGAAAAAFLAALAANSATGTLAGYGPEGYAVFGGLFTLAAALDLKVILSGGVSGAPRIARHVWRLCTALFVAAGAFFFGQQRVMPEFVQGSPLLAIPPFAVLGLMLFWLLRLRFARLVSRFARSRRLRRRAEPAAAPG
ncbi:MAG TPA: hypothetical protein VN231_12495 [Allosphingosinicella sp.]|nr:hypothetical protein [Allosphingosinicella sp.]